MERIIFYRSKFFLAGLDHEGRQKWKCELAGHFSWNVSLFTLTLLHSESPKLYGVFGQSECKRVSSSKAFHDETRGSEI